MDNEKNSPLEGQQETVKFRILATALHDHISKLTDADEIRELLGIIHAPPIDFLLDQIPPEPNNFTEG